MPPEPKISTPETGISIGIAILLDIISIIPFLNVIVALVGFISIELYCMMRGVKAVGRGFAFIEFIPFVSVFPGITLRMIRIVHYDHTQGQGFLGALNPVSAISTVAGTGLLISPKGITSSSETSRRKGDVTEENPSPRKPSLNPQVNTSSQVANTATKKVPAQKRIAA
mgnify:CR=1 FL=1